MSELKCKDCEYQSFVDHNGNPNRYYCEIATTECTPRRLICRTERHSKEFTIKRTPRWCPLKQKCRICGCTWHNACPGGCYWVETDLCSKCAEMGE